MNETQGARSAKTAETRPYLIELLVFVDAESEAVAEGFGQRIAAHVRLRQWTPKPRRAKITSVILSDVREED